jgi:hypothetical protein
LFVSIPAAADEADGDDQLGDAFLLGLGEAHADGATLDVERHGRTLILSGALADSADAEPLELVCMLCTRFEAAARARTLGQSLAERADGEGMTLTDATGLPEVEASQARPLWLPTLLTGLGVAAAAAGTALLLLDGDCASTRTDGDGDCAQVHDLAPAGWGAVGVGATSVVTGIVLFVLFAGDAETGEGDR